ncbi:hypothetical protein QMK19_23335 [Streptomyces sp. H10-C2]|uniref:hypothetical protein n=1 Tax=unclassified Streptomyces TaxID=2593676 RepID=UPI0024B8FCBC|nr:MULTISPECIES: hypothetical protein [unclassified Streptomyces]MDJ0342841.1 hypothetical protein [Streptomyces sp. PH10-H1]MDJ0372519.1 hypothetical protein [Streptomyces sp. H10-C2]
MELMLRDVQAAYYGIGTLFPVIVIDPTPNWIQSRLGARPERSPEGHGMLLLRWTGRPHDEASAPAALRSTARRAPHDAGNMAELQQFWSTLPTGLHLIALSSRLLLGPWDTRPGLTSGQDNQRAAA